MNQAFPKKETRRGLQSWPLKWGLNRRQLRQAKKSQAWSLKYSDSWTKSKPHCSKTKKRAQLYNQSFSNCLVRMLQWAVFNALPAEHQAKSSPFSARFTWLWASFCLHIHISDLPLPRAWVTMQTTHQDVCSVKWKLLCECHSFLN